MENIFSSFEPIQLSPNPSMEEISEYYKANNIVLEDDYLNNLFGLKKPSVPYAPVPPVSTTKPIYDIKKMLETTGVKTALHTTDPVTGISTFKGNPTSVDAKAKEALNFFVNKGLTKEQAAGIIGNLHAESNFNTGVLGDKGTSFGLAQWHNERYDNLKSFAKTHGFSADSFHIQLEYLWHELQTTENNAFKELTKAKTPTESARIFANKFERMKTYNKQREEMANHYYRKFV